MGAFKFSNFLKSSTLGFNAKNKKIINLATPTSSGDATNKAYVDGIIEGSLREQGFWNATTNSPSLVDGTGTQGFYYVVSVAGTQNLGSGSQTFSVGDWVYYNNSNEWKIFETGVGYVPENVANKENTTLDTSTSKYPTNRLVKEQVDTKQATLTEVNFGSFSDSLTAKTALVDADSVNIVDSADSNKSKKITWANIKATLKTYFDTLYGSLANVNIWTKAQRFGFSTLTDAATVAVDLDLANNFNLVLGGNRTLGIPTNPVAGQEGTITIRQDSTGSRTLAYSWPYIFPQLIAPILSTLKGSMDLLAYKVLSYFTATATMTIATPCVVTQVASGLVYGQRVAFTTTGALPTGVSANTGYYVNPTSADTYNIATSLANLQAGTYVASSGSQSGVHTGTHLAILISMNANNGA